MPGTTVLLATQATHLLNRRLLPTFSFGVHFQRLMVAVSDPSYSLAQNWPALEYHPIIIRRPQARSHPWRSDLEDLF